MIDVAGQRIVLSPGDARRLRDVAASRAGRSSAARDLSLLLDRALEGKHVIALRRAEARTLAELGRRIGLPDLVHEINAAAA